GLFAISFLIDLRSVCHGHPRIGLEKVFCFQMVIKLTMCKQKRYAVFVLTNKPTRNEDLHHDAYQTASFNSLPVFTLSLWQPAHPQSAPGRHIRLAACESSG